MIVPTPPVPLPYLACCLGVLVYVVPVLAVLTAPPAWVALRRRASRRCRSCPARVLAICGRPGSPCCRVCPRRWSCVFVPAPGSCPPPVPLSCLPGGGR